MTRHRGGHPGRRRVVSTDPPDVIVCQPVSIPPGVPGSTRHLADCGHEVWLAPSSRKLLAAHRPRILCSSCGAAHIASNPDVEIGVTPEQLAEAEIEFARRRREGPS